MLKMTVHINSYAGHFVGGLVQQQCTIKKKNVAVYGLEENSSAMHAI